MPSISDQAQGRFRLSGGGDISIGPNVYNHSRFGNIPIAVTSSTSFEQQNGHAEGHFNGTAWVITVLQDLPGLARKGQVFQFDRVDGRADAKKAQKDAHLAAHIVAACFGIPL